MKYTFLHISDLHYRPDWHEESELVCNRFFDDITVQIHNFENVYLVFSGDLVLKGEDDNQYCALLKKFSGALDEIGITRNRRICVPGNHDVSRSAIKPFLVMQDGSLSKINDERTFNDTLPQLSKTIFVEKFVNYGSFEAKFANYTCCKEGLGGIGWELEKGIGIYCLNTALCSFGGLEDPTGKIISDKERLHIDTRSLHRWLAESKSRIRILVMHHPLEWLTDWSKAELENTIADNFKLVLVGHRHQGLSTFSSRGLGGSVLCSAPQLFTKKSELLGYAFVSVEIETGDIEVSYRQWTPTHKFVAGTSLSDTDSGKKAFLSRDMRYAPIEVIPSVKKSVDTLTILQTEFDEAITCYSSKKQIWVDRDLSNIPETASDHDNSVIITPAEFISNFRSCIIRAPMQFGLTCVGRYIALEHHRKNKNATVVMIDTTTIPAHKQGVIKHIEARCMELSIGVTELAGIILDNWQNDKSSRRVFEEIKKEFPSTPIIILHSLDDGAEVANVIEWTEVMKFEKLYLWALSRARIRELVAAYIKDRNSLDDDLVTKKLIEDIDALNIHRTPLNCLLILKLLEQAFDDSPVNRTEMIGRVLYLLFYQFDKIPRYATRPDLKDCEYALGYVCEWLIRSSKSSFTKNEFFRKVSEYCTAQIIDLDCEVLFAFLVSENIFIRKGLIFEFRFRYWLYFFAAHRMHHDPIFAKFILGDGRYTAFPEIIEFYTGIDRRRSDAVIHLTEDLKRMNSEFLERTGIPREFDPYQHALWTPSEESLGEMQRQVKNCVAESALPTKVKDRIADTLYDRSKPYHQELAKFIEESSLVQMVLAMKGAARALRNSDHVSPEAKTKLLEEVLLCWIRVCQVMALLSPLVAERGAVNFEGVLFYLGKSFQKIDSVEKRWNILMKVIVENVVNTFQEDIFSKKMGALLGSYLKTHEGSMGELMVLLLMAKQRPPGWEKELEHFIVKSNKNSFYLSRIFATLLSEFKVSFSTERTRQQLRHLAGMSIAKHETGVKRPNMKLVEKATKLLDEEVKEGEVKK
jgi:predicted MPP superfamily phosphohydrolase